MPARAVSLPTFVTLTWTLPFWLIVAPITLSPCSFSIGIDSPVSIDSSTEVRPFINSPSTGNFSPGFTIKTSSTRTSSTEIISS